MSPATEEYFEGIWRGRLPDGISTAWNLASVTTVVDGDFRLPEGLSQRDASPS
jgi:hypothetical protein